ncbi:MAG: Crp/Fnr family transcriptional regulator [Myxococcales bacterium]|nr:Crp/Fnr family transcriptional regulator [Myxococcales bacterium]
MSGEKHPNKMLTIAPEPVRCFACQARQNSEWSNLNDDEVRLLNDAKICNVYRAGQTIFYQGNPAVGVYCIESGTVALKKLDSHGNQVITRLYHAGHTLGYRTFFSGGFYGASAEALSDSRICFVESRTVTKLLSQNPSLGLSFLNHLAKDLGTAEDSMMHMNTLPVRVRLSHLLLTLKDDYGQMRDDGTLELDLPLSRQDLASMIAVRPETLSRTIRSMEDDNVALFKKRRVIVPDLDRLLDELEDSE